MATEFKLLGQLVLTTGGGEPYATFQTRETTDVFLCPQCSALVADPEAHGRWHTVAKIGLG